MSYAPVGWGSRCLPPFLPQSCGPWVWSFASSSCPRCPHILCVCVCTCKSKIVYHSVTLHMKLLQSSIFVKDLVCGCLIKILLEKRHKNILYYTEKVRGTKEKVVGEEGMRSGGACVGFSKTRSSAFSSQRIYGCRRKQLGYSDRCHG